MWTDIQPFLPRPALQHPEIGLTDDECARVDCFDVEAATLLCVQPSALTPTQEIVEPGRLFEMIVSEIELPPIEVVAVQSLQELRILDGHHRACLAAPRGERVSAWVVEV